VTSAASRISSRTARGAARLAQRLPAAIRRLLNDLRGQDLFLFSAGLAFYALVSIAPLVILVMWVTSLVLGDERVHQLAADLGRAAPEGIGADQALRKVANLGTTVGAWAMLTAIWPATAYGAGLRRAFDRLSRKREEQFKGLRGRGLGLLVLMPVFVLGSLVSAYVGTEAAGNGPAGAIAGVAVALVTGFVGASIAIVLIYRIFPPSRMSWPEIGRATVVAAGGIAVLSVAFVAFLASGTNFEDHYITSGLAGIVLLGVWLFLANALLLVGYKAGQQVTAVAKGRRRSTSAAA
jgi:membrane protein